MRTTRPTETPEQTARRLAAELGFTLTTEPVKTKKPGLYRVLVTGHGKTMPPSITWAPVVTWLRKQAELLRLDSEARARAIARGRTPKSPVA